MRRVEAPGMGLLGSAGSYFEIVIMDISSHDFG